jgi:hypothetical protein
MSTYDLEVDTTNNDLIFNDVGEFSLVYNGSLVAQRVRQRLSTHTEEWDFDRELGIDYLNIVMRKDPNLELIRASFLEQINATEGVDEIISFDLDTQDRRLLVNTRFSSGGNVLEVGGAVTDTGLIVFVS